MLNSINKVLHPKSSPQQIDANPTATSINNTPRQKLTAPNETTLSPRTIPQTFSGRTISSLSSTSTSFSPRTAPQSPKSRLSEQQVDEGGPVSKHTRKNSETGSLLKRLSKRLSSEYTQEITQKFVAVARKSDPEQLRECLQARCPTSPKASAPSNANRAHSNVEVAGTKASSAKKLVKADIEVVRDSIASLKKRLKALNTLEKKAPQLLHMQATLQQLTNTVSVSEKAEEPNNELIIGQKATLSPNSLKDLTLRLTHAVTKLKESVSEEANIIETYASEEVQNLIAGIKVSVDALTSDLTHATLKMNPDIGLGYASYALNQLHTSVIGIEKVTQTVDTVATELDTGVHVLEHVVPLNSELEATDAALKLIELGSSEALIAEKFLDTSIQKAEVTLNTLGNDKNTNPLSTNIVIKKVLTSSIVAETKTLTADVKKL